MALENTSTTSYEKETLDFMNVESFSQLPFIRPHAAAAATAFANSSSKEKPIRLFGIEFGVNSSEAAAAAAAAGGGGDDSSADEKNNAEETSAHVKEDESSSNNNNNNNHNNRRFECHYCCRNFPTSQALGGHQNAHKRERQHAKRAHLADAHHIYGLMNYTARLGSGPNNITDYPSWTSSNTPRTTRFYGTHHHHLHHQSSSYSQAQAPINGSPLGVWRIPGAASSSASAVQSHHASFNWDRSILQQQGEESPLPLFGSSSQDHRIVVGGSKSSQLTQSSSSGFAFHETKPGSYDHVSLDLHL